MKRFNHYLFVLFAALLAVFSSCNKDVGGAPAPQVTGPAGIITIETGNTADISFSVNIPGGYKNASPASSSGAILEIKSEPSQGATSGEITVKYTATGGGVDNLQLTVADKFFQTATGDATVEVTGRPANVVLAGIIREDSTLTPDRIWELQGRVIIDAGATLTIEPGTIIKGREGAGTNASALIISRGAKINAGGTPDKPIIFTTILDNIQVGETAGTNLAKEDNEKWGGLIILGRAPVSAGDGDTESSIEGLPADEPYAKYGGDRPDDNSGILRYVSIRHGGISIGAGNEINGLTLGGVGNGTVIENIEIFATLDDGIEFFGGTVNMKNVMVTWQGDDGLDIDQNYAGTIENFMIFHGVGVDTDEGLEIDGPEGTTHIDGLFTLKNGTVINDGQEGTPADFKAKAQGNISNVVFEGYSAAVIKFRASYTDTCDPKEDAFTHLTDTTPVLIFNEIKYDGIKVYTKSQTCSVTDTEQAAAEAVMPPSSDTAGGADPGVFDWTLTKKTGLAP